MKLVIVKIIATAIFITALFSQAFAQDGKIDQAYQTTVIEKLSELMIENYVFPDVAKKTSEHLKQQLDAGAFGDKNDLQSFAEALTQEVQSVNKDKHMRIRPAPAREAPANTTERMIEEHLDRHNFLREITAGFKAAEKLDGNIGYLDLRGFASVKMGAPVADAYMQLLSSSDAIIIDLRKNGGGDPEMVQYLCSYFFDEHVHLNSLYWRRGDRTDEFWTLEKVNGKKLPDVPLFVLTSNYTFSGAEEFSYNMQTQKRATLIGETTGGGANPGGGFPINEQLMVFIPTGRAINPITQTNWEGVGVVPEIKTTAEEALDKAIELATAAAEKYRKEKQEQYQKLLASLHQSLAKIKDEKEQEAIIKQIKKGTAWGILDEASINHLGYEYLMDQNNAIAAETLFKTNVQLFPNSANVYDSYAELLAKQGKIKLAIQNYKKAVAIAEANEDQNLPLFKENLKKAASKMKDQNTKGK